MSANNYLEVKWRKNSYHVRMKDADTGYQLGKTIGNAKKLETAIRIANDFMSKEIVEYGLTVIPRPEKKNE